MEMFSTLESSEFYPRGASFSDVFEVVSTLGAAGGGRAHKQINNSCNRKPPTRKRMSRFRIPIEFNIFRLDYFHSDIRKISIFNKSPQMSLNTTKRILTISFSDDCEFGTVLNLVTNSELAFASCFCFSLRCCFFLGRTASIHDRNLPPNMLTISENIQNYILLDFFEIFVA